jgi:hypothetical protein
MHQPYVIILTTWRYTWTTWTSAVFTKVCFCPYTSEKQFCLNDINASVMSRLDDNQRLCAIGMLQAGLAQNVRCLLRTVLELISRNPGMLLTVRLDVWNRFRRCTSLMWLYWRRDVIRVNDINASVMSRLDDNQRLCAIGMLQAGLAQNVVAIHFGCHRNTKLSLWKRFRHPVFWILNNVYTTST